MGEFMSYQRHDLQPISTRIYRHDGLRRRDQAVRRSDAENLPPHGDYHHEPAARMVSEIRPSTKAVGAQITRAHHRGQATGERPDLRTIAITAITLEGMDKITGDRSDDVTF